MEPLATICYGTRFQFNNIEYVRDEATRDGGGRLACRNIVTNEIEMLPGQSLVELSTTQGRDPSQGFADFLPRR